MRRILTEYHGGQGSRSLTAVLYDLGLHAAIGYPDFIEDDNRLFLSETRKTVARVHEVPSWLLDRLFAQERNI